MIQWCIDLLCRSDIHTHTQTCGECVCQHPISGKTNRRSCRTARRTLTVYNTNRHLIADLSCLKPLSETETQEIRCCGVIWCQGCWTNLHLIGFPGSGSLHLSDRNFVQILLYAHFVTEKQHETAVELDRCVAKWYHKMSKYFKSIYLINVNIVNLEEY